MRPFVVVLAVLVLGTACESESGADTSGRAISASDYGDEWPLTLQGGVLACEGAGMVTFTAEGKTYAINGLAGGAADERGWAEIDPVWADDPEIEGAKISIGPLIDDGLALCDE
jgi:hypothetical protein